jgi:RimJ/RimL family protein N-acetyltransferase
MFANDTVVYIKNENSKKVRSIIAYYNYDLPVSECRVNVFTSYYFLCNFSTAEEHWNKGFATRILKYIFRKANDRPIELTVDKDNKAALHLYEKFGFKIKPGTEDDYDGYLLRMIYTRN